METFSSAHARRRGEMSIAFGTKWVERLCRLSERTHCLESARRHFDWFGHNFKPSRGRQASKGAGQISSDTPVLPHKCGVPPGYGTPLYAAAKNSSCARLQIIPIPISFSELPIAESSAAMSLGKIRPMEPIRNAFAWLILPG